MPQPILIKNLSGGIITDFSSNNKAVEGREGQYTKTSGIDLYRPNFQGHITPAGIFNLATTDTAAGGGVNSIPQATTTDVTTSTGPYMYFILSGLSGTAPRWVRFTSVNVQDAYNPISLTGTHSGHNFTTIPSAGTGTWGEDVVIYLVNSIPYLFYSWNDASDGDVGRILLSNTATEDPDYISTVPAGSLQVLTKNVPHRLVEGPDKLLYISDGRYAHTFDGATGANGTFTANVYDMGAGWIITDIRVDKNYLVISAVRTATFNYYTFFSKSKVAYWIPGEAGGGIIYDIPDSFTSAIYKYGETMYAFTTGKNNTTKIIPIGRETSIKEFGSGIYGLPPKPNSIDIYNGNLVWIPKDALGDYVMQMNPQGGLHLSAIINDGTNDSSQTSGGVLKNIQGNNLYTGGLFSGVYKLVYLDGITNGYGTTKDLRTREYRLPYRSVIDKIQVFFSQMASGSSCQISLFKNYVATSVGTIGTDLLAEKPLATMSFSVDGALTEREIPCGITLTSAFYLNVRVSGQISIPEILIYWH